MGKISAKLLIKSYAIHKGGQPKDSMGAVPGTCARSSLLHLTTVFTMPAYIWQLNFSQTGTGLGNTLLHKDISINLGEFSWVQRAAFCDPSGMQK